LAPWLIWVVPAAPVLGQHPAVRQIDSGCLIRRGSVSLAPSGLQAVTDVRRDRPDVVLMDMSLPEMDGWEARLIEKIHALVRIGAPS
jgi:CheY-like chemotaxis protein